MQPAIGAPPPYPAVPEAFVGVWQRTLLEVRGTPAEDGWQVFWLQTPHWHGDLRLPATRPDFSGCARTADCAAEQVRWLARQKGFAGITEIGSTAGLTYCQWHRQVDFQPARAGRDYGRMVVDPAGNRLDEFGVDSDYRETWVRLDRSAGPCAAWHRGGAGATQFGERHFGELLLVAGACFIFLRDRGLPLPPGDCLATLVTGPGAAAWLDMEISFGDWVPSRGTGVVTHSTLPWCEGRTRGGDGGWQALPAGR